MPSLRSTLLAAAMAVVAIAQTTPQIDPESVDEGTRDRWCNDQITSCPFICEQTEPRTTLENDCDSNSLTFNCICGDNKPANLTEYTLTLPFYICQEKGQQCQKACAGDNSCAAACFENNPCGATSPRRANGTATTTLPEATTSSGGDRDTVFTGRPGQDNNNEGGSGGSGAGALNVAGAYGMAVVVGGLFAGFALL